MEDVDYAGPALSDRPPTSAEFPGTANVEHRPRWWLAAFLFLASFVFCTTLGVFWAVAIRTDVSTDLFPYFSVITWETFRRIWTDPALLKVGLSFSIPALTILGSHEMGHYLACRRYRIPSTLPYFLPVPIAFGTMGAFIRIKAPIRRKKELFDVGIAGPLAGFVVIVPLLLLGVARSTPSALPAAAVEGQPFASLLMPGPCLAIDLLTRLFHGPLPEGTVLNLHPFAMAAWFGLFVTSLNLLPLGQLDGGHILYAAIGSPQRRMVVPLWLALLSMSLVWPGWAVWAIITLILRLQHPPVVDEDVPLDTKRRALAWVALAILILSFIPRPLDERLVRLGTDGTLQEVAGAQSSTKVTGPSLTSSTSM